MTDAHPHHILVVDDHEEIRDLLGSYLRQHGFAVTVADGGEQMRKALAAVAIDLVVLDVMMPGEDGLTLLRGLREQKGPPVIMLTAMGEDADCVIGLEMGADDYVTKPFVPRVLLARIKAVLRRQSPQHQEETAALVASGFVRFDDWRLDLLQRQLLREDDVVIPLSQSEFGLLQVFVDHPRQVLDRDRLMTLTKGREAHPFDRSIDNLVSRLRKKIEEDAANPALIKTVWGGGYLFTPAVEK